MSVGKVGCCRGLIPVEGCRIGMCKIWTAHTWKKCQGCRPRNLKERTLSVITESRVSYVTGWIIHSITKLRCC